MKKVAIVFMILCLLAACSEKSDNSSIKITENILSEENDSSATSITKKAINIDEPVITSVPNETEIPLEELIDNNIICINEMFFNNTLSGTEFVNENNSFIYYVDDPRFKNLEDVKAFVTSTYCEEEADRLLYHYVGNPVYYEIDNRLIADCSRSGGMDYPYIWDDYKFDYKYITNDLIYLIVYIKAMYTGDDQPADTFFIMKVKKEDSAWKLERMYGIPEYD